ncbi:hypothetical protein [Halovulum sp. GXIMD14793]
MLGILSDVMFTATRVKPTGRDTPARPEDQRRHRWHPQACKSDQR